jgi:hypothetical protein
MAEAHIGDAALDLCLASGASSISMMAVSEAAEAAPGLVLPLRVE